MPPKKQGKFVAPRSKAKATPTRRSTRQRVQDDDVPDVFQEMLADLPDKEKISRPAKRRKRSTDHMTDAVPSGLSTDISHDIWRDPNEEAESLAANGVITKIPAPAKVKTVVTSEPLPRQEQTVYDDSATDSDDSIEFEDVNINGISEAGPSVAADTNRASGPVTISLTTPAKINSRRKQITKADRLHRLAVHKWHYLCLMLHTATVNQWCNDADVQASLKKLIPRKLISRLHREGTQAERKFAFDSAVLDLNGIWKNSFKKTERGIESATWRDLTTMDLADEMENAPEPIDFADFKRSAKSGKKQGSPDLGAQLFCALCRSLAVETRLICSLQMLPFTMATGQSAKSTDDYIQAGQQDFGTSICGNGRPRPTFSKHPVWWVEVLNPAIDQWVAVDPDSNHQSYNQPRTHYEPPMADALNSMSYVVAFEENGSARDVTKRYTSAYNAKTRKLRIESTKDGENWLSNVMSFFAKREPEARDQIEDAELNRRVALEGMPRNVQDFKDHPVYVLERHLKSTEVIQPRKECGRLKVGKDKLETVYRREHVHACRTADGWYRRGRNVVNGMQPLRHVPKRRGVNDEEEESFAALYAEYQTEVYVPPEVRDGRVPRNAFGNLDVYVPTMIPMGGVHIRHSFAIEAAKTLGIDYVEAVTGFKFKGRQGTAVMDGIVVAAEHLSIIKEVVTAIEEESIGETNDKRDAILERVWAAMMRVLRVQQMVQLEYADAPTRKVSVYDQENEAEEAGLEDETDDEDDLTYEDADAAGGFTVEATEATAETRAAEAAQLSTMRDNRPIALPPPIVRQKIIVVLSPHKPIQSKPPIPQEESYNDLFDDPPDPPHSTAASFQPTRDEIADGGGFIDEEVEGGGFINSPSDSPQPRGQDVASNMHEHVSVDQYVDDTMTSSDVQVRDDISETTPSPDPISTPDYPEITPLPRTGSELGEALGKTQKDKSRSSAEVAGNAPEIIGNAKSYGTDFLPPHDSTAASLIAMTKVNEVDEADEINSLPSHDPEEDDMEPEWVSRAFSPEV